MRVYRQFSLAIFLSLSYSIVSWLSVQAMQNEAKSTSNKREYSMIDTLIPSPEPDTASAEYKKFIRGYHLRHRPSGLLRFSIVDSASGQLLDSAIVQWANSLYKWKNSYYWKSRWTGPGQHSFYVSHQGYRTVEVLAVPVAEDSLTEVKVFMTPGSDTIHGFNGGENLYQVSVKEIEGLPVGMLVGKVVDIESSDPIASAEIWLENSNTRGSTDKEGSFRLECTLQDSIIIHVWHPRYDSVRIHLSKKYDRTTKTVTIHMESMPRNQKGSIHTARRRSGFVITTEKWAKGGLFTERHTDAYLLKAGVGEVFGPIDRWFHSDCHPFRLIRSFSDGRAWVQFTRDLGPAAKYLGNFAEITRQPTTFYTKTMDAGVIVTLQLLPAD